MGEMYGVGYGHNTLDTRLAPESGAVVASPDDDAPYDQVFDSFINYPTSPRPVIAVQDHDSFSSSNPPELVSPGLSDPSPSPSWLADPATPAPYFNTPQYAVAPVNDNVPAADDLQGLDRSFSKKRRTQTGLSLLDGLSSLTGLARTPSKRRKRNDGGFPCIEPGCSRCYNRECDLKKHIGRKHKDECETAHECIQCDKRFHYPKDVWRHLQQWHNMTVPPKEPQSIRKQIGCPCCSQKASAWLADNNKAENVSQAMDLDTSVGISVKTSEPTSPTSSNLLWTLTQSIMKFRRLSLKAHDDRLIMVTNDKQNFKEVDVSGVGRSDGLSGKIISALGLPTGTQLASAYTYHHRKGLGPKLDTEGLLSLITKTSNDAKTLKFYVATVPPATT